MSRIKLGDIVRDWYTGFTGVAIARTEWLYGCTRITVQPTELRDGQVGDSESFDEQRIDLVTEVQTVGDDPEPARAKDPIG